MIAVPEPAPEPITILTASTEPRCVQCHEVVTVERAAARANAALCADCALDGMPHTD
jgi:formylmethanofuran dehydrogenase subunit E